MMAEFLQNGHVVASRSFASDDATYVYFYLPPGTYQVSLRVDPSFRYHGVKFSYSGAPNNGFIVSGATVTIADHTTYLIQATNYF
jgi:hypothetical protein